MWLPLNHSNHYFAVLSVCSGSQITLNCSSLTIHHKTGCRIQDSCLLVMARLKRKLPQYVDTWTCIDAIHHFLLTGQRNQHREYKKVVSYLNVHSGVKSEIVLQCSQEEDIGMLWTLPQPGVLLHRYRITAAADPAATSPFQSHMVANSDDSSWSSPVKAKLWLKTCSLRRGKQNKRKRTNNPTRFFGCDLNRIFFSGNKVLKSLMTQHF